MLAGLGKRVLPERPAHHRCMLSLLGTTIVLFSFHPITPQHVVAFQGRRMASALPSALLAPPPCASTDIKMFCMAKTRLGLLYAHTSRYRQATARCFPGIGNARAECQVKNEDLEKAYKDSMGLGTNDPSLTGNSVVPVMKSRSRMFMVRKAILENSCFQCVKLHCRQQAIIRLEKLGVQWDREPEQQCLPRHAQWLHPELTNYHAPRYRPPVRVHASMMPEKVVVVTLPEKVRMKKDVALARTELQVHDARKRGQRAKQSLELVSTSTSNANVVVFVYENVSSQTLKHRPWEL